MSYRVYRAGETEPVRTAPVPSRASPRPAPGARRGARAWLRRFAAAVGVALAALFVWRYGAEAWSGAREVWSNSLAAVDLVRLSGRVPDWVFIAVPAVATAVLILATTCLAYARHAVVRALGIVVVIAALAAPGYALGWVNGTVGAVAHRDPNVNVAVDNTKKELDEELPGKAMNILLIGRDEASEGDAGRSDTQILVRLDPDSKSISMLSLPRDLRVDVPGVGLTKMNSAYSYGGAALVVKTFTQVTGLPVNHFVEIDFAGFWHVVNILGGVYIPVDHRYFNPESSSYKSIDIDPGYQLMKGHDALDFVRFRHDQQGDFTRMQRQQLFLRELQRQSGRWSSDWSKVIKLIKAVTGETTSDVDSLKRLSPIVRLIFAVDTSKINSVHVEGSTPMIDGVSYVEATAEEIQQAVAEFTNPAQRKASSGTKVGKKACTVSVYNTTTTGGLATSVADQLAAQGYDSAVGVDAPEAYSDTTIVYAAPSLRAVANDIADMLGVAEVRIVERVPGAAGGVRVFLGSGFSGVLDVPESEAQSEVQTVQTDERHDEASWVELDAKTPMHLEMPTVWSSNLGYEEFYAYGITTLNDKRSAAAYIVGTTAGGGYWGIQAMRWADPPAIENPSAKKQIDGRRYLLFYQGDRLHMVSWKSRNVRYWVTNTLDNELSDDLMMAISTSFQPVE